MFRNLAKVVQSHLLSSCVSTIITFIQSLEKHAETESEKEAILDALIDILHQWKNIRYHYTDENLPNNDHIKGE